MNVKTIIKNAKIYTSDEKQPWADSLVMENGKFIYVGNSKQAMTYAGKTADGCEDVSMGSETGSKRECSAEIIDMDGKMILPTFIDAHTHIGLSVIMDGEDDSLPMWDCKSKQEILEKLRTHVKKHPFALYYTAFFGQVEALGEEKLTRDDLDKIVKHRPVILIEQECHSAWLNSGAMKFLKIKEDIEDMAPGYCFYERDEKGRLTGCITEMTMLPILELSGNISNKKMKAGILKIADYLLEHGVSTIYDAGNYLNEEKTYRLLAEMDRAGKLPIRYEATYIICRPDKADIAIDELKRYKLLYETENIRFNTVKIMFDGTHRAHTAKLVEPYNDRDTTGGTMIPEDKLYELLSGLNREGIDFHAHTVGEGASKMILDCAERIRHEQGGLNINITLAHLETQCDEDIKRFKELGVTANYTPHWHGGNDYGTIEQTEKLLGKKRASNLFRAKSVMDTGANVTFSSDEVTLQLLDRWNPFLGIQTGHTRQEINDGGRTALVFPPIEERLTIKDMVKGYTINPAKVLRLDEITGSVEAGKSADFMVLNKNPFETDPYEIHNIKPEAVVVNGRVVKGRL